MNAALWMLSALAVVAIGYRYYSAFLAARVLVLNDARITPAHTLNDGLNYQPTNRWVVLGHHFAAITGAGPLIGPVLAAQFGFFPGYFWILIGVVLGGAVQDFVILVASVRRGGRSLAEIAREELGPKLGFVTSLTILFIIVIALAGLGNVVVGALSESAWGVFTVAASIPIAICMGVHIQRFRGGSARGIREATIAGCIALLAALIAGKWVADTNLADYLRISRTSLTLAIAAYGFFASVLPVWVLLCPRDYLSSYLKLGTIALLIVGIVVVNPAIQMPGISQWVDGGGPIIKGSVFPFVFITIACGAISGFHALVASGTTPKMVDRERDCRMIGYGAMLMEGIVGITALIAACVMSPTDYVAINTDPSVAIVASEQTHGVGLARSIGQLEDTLPFFSNEDRRIIGLNANVTISSVATRSIPASRALALSNRALAGLGYHVDPDAKHAESLDSADFLRLGLHVKDLPRLSKSAGEVVAARTGGGVSLAIGMAEVFSHFPGMSKLLSYWYHFAIMFEALFVLTTIDAGTRIGRFVVQDFLRFAVPKWGESTNLVGNIVATSLIVAAWSYFILTGSISTIWPMFGIANQLLACTALCIGTTILVKTATKRRYALVTFLPLLFVGTTTLSAAILSLRDIYIPMARDPSRRPHGIVNATVTIVLLGCVIFVAIGSARAWVGALRNRRAQN